MTGIEVAAIRQKLGLTQERFARELGCTARSVGGWERGEHTPRGLSSVMLKRLERRAYTEAS